MSDRIPCKSPGCTKTILPATAARTGGLCMPCVQEAARLAHEAYIKQNRRDVNEFAGVEDPVEVLKIIHRPHQRDPLINLIPYPTPTDQIYTQLSQHDLGRLLVYAAALVGTERQKEARAIVLCAAAFTNAKMEDCLSALAACRSFRPSMPFRRASPALRDDLIRRVEVDAENRRHLLLALAWIGDETVVELFAGWRQHPPAWCQSWSVPPEDYALEAGWELTADGTRRQLYFDTCTALVRGPSASPNHFTAVIDRDDVCPWCGKKLTNLFEVSPAAVGLMALDHLGGLLQVGTCLFCTAFGTIIFGAVDETGKSLLSPMNTRPAYLPDRSDDWNRLPQNVLTPGARRSPFFAADQFLPTTFSQMGGHPTWIQHAEYPRCPGCQKTMLFIAQLCHEDIEDFAEGTYYAFICPTCRTTATTYQQT